MVKPTINDFIFSPKFRLARHFTYWFFYLLVWACYWTVATDATFIHNTFKMLVYLPAFLAFTYPLVYVVVPRLLLKSKYFQFLLFVLCWGVAGWFFNAFYRAYIFLPAQPWAGFPLLYKNIYEPASFLCMTTTAGCMTISSFTKRWMLKQKELARIMEEKMTAQLQVLKAQLHPHFLFNTLNNITSVAL